MRRSNSSERVAHQVGAAIKRLRQERGMRQYRVAELAGINRAMLCHYERGRNCPALPILIRLLKAMDCDAETFGRRLGPWGCAGQAAAPWTPECRVALSRLRQARKEAGLTQAAAGQRFGAGRNLVSKVERGGRRLDAGELARFAAIYGKPWDWFLA